MTALVRQAAWDARALPLGSALLTGAAIILSAVAILSGSFWMPAALFGAACVYCLVFRNWKWGILGLLAYLPFSGIPALLLYPAPGIVVLLKDLLFVIPAYLAFVLGAAPKRRGRSFFFPGAPVALICALAVVVCLGLLNPSLLSPMVGLIGVKVWLFYVPLYFLGYHLVESKASLVRLLRTILWVGMLSVLIGLLETVLLYTGHSDAVYGALGPAAQAATQEFAGFVVGGGQTLVRIPGTFTFVTQYWAFLFGMLAIGFSVWAASERQGERLRGIYPVFVAMITVAALTSGARAAMVMVPAFYLLVMAVGLGWRSSLRSVLLIAGAIAVVITLLGTTARDLFRFVGAVVAVYSGTEGGIAQETVRVFASSWLMGLGTGMSTGPARYAFAGGDPTGSLASFEGYYTKTIAELGILGIVVVVALLSRILFLGYRAFRQLRDGVLRVVGGCLFVYMILEVLSLVKGAAALDLDPSNIYFWLFGGVLMKLPSLELSQEVVVSIPRQSRGVSYRTLASMVMRMILDKESPRRGSPADAALL